VIIKMEHNNFWLELYYKHKGKRPILCVAPMADVTDMVFRKLIAEKSGKTDSNTNLDILWTEFVSVNGLSHPTGREKLLIDLKYSEIERPIIAQIFGEDSIKYKEIAGLCADLKFDGIDINMGCPDKNVLGQKAGSYLINTPDIAKQIILETMSGARGLPVSVKTRIGYNVIEYQKWLGEILTTKPVAITIHLRTRKEMSLVPAHWELSAEIVQYIRDNFGYPEQGGPIVMLNGDVKDVDDAVEKWKLSNCDGIMIGRGIFGNPWLFNSNFKKEDLSIKEILLTMVEHTYNFERELAPHKNFAIMKKHFKAYVNNFDGAKELRVKLMDTKQAVEVEKIIKNWLRWQWFYRIIKRLKSML
jgi:tRNA-dihydrouridine synthase